MVYSATVLHYSHYAWVTCGRTDSQRNYRDFNHCRTPGNWPAVSVILAAWFDREVESLPYNKVQLWNQLPSLSQSIRETPETVGLMSPTSNRQATDRLPTGYRHLATTEKLEELNRRFHLKCSVFFDSSGSQCDSDHSNSRLFMRYPSMSSIIAVLEITKVVATPKLFGYNLPTCDRQIVVCQ